MTDTRSPRSMDEDQRELLAELDELFPDSSSDERLLGHAADGALAFGQDADENPADGLGELEALFDTFYEEGKEAPDESPNAPSAASDPGDDQGVGELAAVQPPSAAWQEETASVEGEGQEDIVDALPDFGLTDLASQGPSVEAVTETGSSEDPGTSTPDALAGIADLVPPGQTQSFGAAKEAGAVQGANDLDAEGTGSGPFAGIGGVDPNTEVSAVDAPAGMEAPESGTEAQESTCAVSGGEGPVAKDVAGSGEGTELQEGASGEPEPAGQVADAPAPEDAGSVFAQGGPATPMAGNTEAGKKAIPDYPRVPVLETGAGEAVALPGQGSRDSQSLQTDGESADSAGAQDDVADSQDAEDSEGELFPFVPRGTVIDSPPPRTSLALTPEPDPVKTAGVTGKIALAAGALGLLIAGGAGWLAWKAQEEVAAMHERIGTLQPAAPAANQESGTFGNRLSDLTQRVDALAATGGAGDREEIAAVKAELKLLATRFGGLDARLESLRARLGSSSSQAATEDAKTEPAEPAHSGRWAVNLASFADQATARGELKRIRALGLDAEVASAPADGRTWYRIRVPGFASATQAKKFVRTEAAPAGFEKAWVGPQ